MVTTVEGLRDEFMAIVDDAFEHAVQKIPGLDRESFLNGFLFGYKFSEKLPWDKRFVYERVNPRSDN